MAGTTRVGDLEIGQDLKHERIKWKIETIGFHGILLVLAVAGAGGFGDGPLAWACIGEPGSTFWVEHERIGRHDSPMQLRVHARAPAGAARLEVGIDRGFLEGIELKRVDPEPEVVLLGSDRCVFRFALVSAGEAGTVVFHYEPRRRGWMGARVGLVGGPELVLCEFILP